VLGKDALGALEGGREGMSEGMSERQEVMPPCWVRTPLALWREGGRV